MGKFCELFEMDVHVGAKELGLQYMKVLIGLSTSTLLFCFLKLITEEIYIHILILFCIKIKI